MLILIVAAAACSSSPAGSTDAGAVNDVGTDDSAGSETVPGTQPKTLPPDTSWCKDTIDDLRTAGFAVVADDLSGGVGQVADGCFWNAGSLQLTRNRESSVTIAELKANTALGPWTDIAGLGDGGGVIDGFGIIHWIWNRKEHLLGCLSCDTADQQATANLIHAAQLIDQRLKG